MWKLLNTAPPGASLFWPTQRLSLPSATVPTPQRPRTGCAMLGPSMNTLIHPYMVRALRKRVGNSHRRRRAPATRHPYPVFIAYTDVSAARQAICRLTTLLQASHPDRELQPMLWRFAQLDQPRWREMALREASRANTLVLAMNASATLSSGTDAWLTALAAQQRGAEISALMLMGDEAWIISLQHTAAKAANVAQLRPASAPDCSLAQASRHAGLEAVCAA